VSDPGALLTAPGRVALTGAPAGYDALLAARIAAETGRDILHVARDDAAMARMAEALAFFAPGRAVLTLPAWDCLPYDRVSPHADIVARRVAALAALADPAAAGPRVLLTTVNALLQRVPPPAVFAGAARRFAPGDRIDVEELTVFLAANGYGRTETVMEPGEYALRGGLVDIFPPGAEAPLRLDLFGDEIETIRRFDPLTQRSSGSEDAVALLPAGELLLDDQSIRRFRDGYRTLFGAVAGDDPLYESIAAGQRHPGMEHWLALFHEELVPLTAYLPDAILLLDSRAEEARESRLDQIADHYAARLAAGDVAATAIRAPVYHPVPPERLYLGRADWERLLDGHPVGVFSPFDAPPAGGDAAPAFAAHGRPGRDFADARARRDLDLFDAVKARIVEEHAAGRRVVVAGFSRGSRERLAGLMASHDIGPLAPVADWAAVEALPAGTVALAVLGLESGFATPDLAVIGEQDILGERLARPARRRAKASDQFIAEASALSAGDLVVHAEHGIGRYEGLETLAVGGADHDCLRLVYHGGDKLFLPVENIDLITRYGADGADSALDRLGGAAWQARKAKLKKRIQDMAMGLISIAAERSLRGAPVLKAPESEYAAFCARFPFSETEDQERAIAETLADLADGRCTDRLICGDVGFGKTEVALRAAFAAAMSGAQVAVVTPTTLLCRQHFRVFRDRFAGFPVRIAQLSRLVTAKEAAATRKALAEGKIDIVIGTHALLGKSVRFADLGLLVVDEEQHFGVAQKERIKSLKANVHVLTLTATPIPRTLQLALTGVRELSLVSTPPVDRLAVRSFVAPDDPITLRDALSREKLRGGQSFYVCPRIEDLPDLQRRLKELVPDLKVATAHGRLPAAELEEIMEGFYEGAFDLLLSTNIVESGLDIPTANTLIVHRADRFGLAQLYQLRGRIGRGKQRGYAYFTLPDGQAVTPAALKRLEVMQALDMLGAGFTLASHDMDIRGAGNLLGEEQSGHVREVGIELYQQLLEEAVAAARGEGTALAEDAFSPQINVGMPVLIPEAYVADLGLRLALYRRIAGLAGAAEIDAFAAEMIDRFGPLPSEVENLLATVAIKRFCRAAGIERLEAGPKGAVLAFHRNSFANPDKLVAYIAANAADAKLRPDHRLVLQRDWTDPAARLDGAREIAAELAELAA